MPRRKLNILNPLLRIRDLSLLNPLILLLLKYLHTPIKRARRYNQSEFGSSPLHPPQRPALHTDFGLFVPLTFVVFAVDADGFVGGAGGDALTVPVETYVVDYVLVEGGDEFDGGGGQVGGLLQHESRSRRLNNIRPEMREITGYLLDYEVNWIYEYKPSLHTY